MTDPDRVKSLSDFNLLKQAAFYNAELRRGRRLVAEGEALIKANINEFVIHTNELQSRASAKLELETDYLDTDSKSASE